MADGIQRYWRVGTEMEEADDGRWVLFSDVQARLQADAERIRELEAALDLTKAVAAEKLEAADAVVSTASVVLRCDQGMACECHRDLARALAAYRSVGKDQEGDGK